MHTTGHVLHLAVGLKSFVFIHTSLEQVGRGHRNVRLINNTISDIETWALWVSSASGVTLQDNRFERIWTLPTWADCCPPYPVPPSTVVFMTQADGIAASGNCIVSHGQYATTLINVTATAQLVSTCTVCDYPELSTEHSKVMLFILS